MSIFFNSFCLSEEIKGRCSAIIQKQIITTIRRESEKTRGMVLANPCSSQTRRLASDFKACVKFSDWEIWHKKKS